jgi:hypothetical protein
MHATLEQLLQLARVESASTGTAPSTEGTAIAEALHLACRQSLQRASKGDTPTPRLQTDLEPAALHDWELPLAPALLTCAVTNLVDNALRHHLGEQPITLQLSLQLAGTGTAGVPMALMKGSTRPMAQQATERRARQRWRPVPARPAPPPPCRSRCGTMAPD